MSKAPIVYDFSGVKPEGAIDGTLELLDPVEERKQAEDEDYRGLFAGKLDGDDE